MNTLRTAVAAVGRYATTTALATILLYTGASFTIERATGTDNIVVFKNSSGQVGYIDNSGNAAFSGSITVQGQKLGTGASLTEASGDTRYVNEGGDTATGTYTFSNDVTVGGNLSGSTVLSNGAEIHPNRSVAVQLTASGGSLTTGSSQARFPIAFSGTLVYAVATHGSAGDGLVTYDVNIDGTSALSTKLTVDANETTSEDAAAPHVIDAANDDAQLWSTVTIDVDSDAGATAPQLVTIMLVFKPDSDAFVDY